MANAANKSGDPYPALEPAFESRLALDSRWALSEGSQFFAEKGAVQAALRRIAQRLNELGIPYAVAGGMALFQHGYRRFTEDVDILVTKEGLKEIHKALDGRGYVRPFERSKNLRDTEAGVRIEFLLAGDHPGDGKPKAVAFPNPQTVSIEREGIRYLSLPALVELKLASGMTGSDRMKDLADVQELIKILGLPEEFATNIDASVRDRYEELWRDVHRRSKRYLKLWRSEPLTKIAQSLNELVALLGDAAGELREMLADGVELDSTGSTGDAYKRLITTDPAIAKKYGMEDEAEFWGDVEEPEGPSPNL